MSSDLINLFGRNCLIRGHLLTDEYLHCITNLSLQCCNPCPHYFHFGLTMVGDNISCLYSIKERTVSCEINLFKPTIMQTIYKIQLTKSKSKSTILGVSHGLPGLMGLCKPLLPKIFPSLPKSAYQEVFFYHLSECLCYV